VSGRRGRGVAEVVAELLVFTSPPSSDRPSIIRVRIAGTESLAVLATISHARMRGTPMTSSPKSSPRSWRANRGPIVLLGSSQSNAETSVVLGSPKRSHIR
jgi:hypothetical protein